jgi:hypothetical protein
MVMMATVLGLSDVEVEDSLSAWPRNAAKQRLEMFKKWQEKKSSEATYRYVCMILCEFAILYMYWAIMHGIVI